MRFQPLTKKMKYCATCEKAIAKKAKRCPYCGAKNKKKFYKKISFWFFIGLLLLIVVNMIFDKPTGTYNENNVTTTQKTLNYKNVYKGGAIKTDFVSITIDEISTAKTIYSKNSSAVLNSDPGDTYVYVKGKITNTSSRAYNVGGMGSWSYDTNTYLDADLELTNGESEYGSLLIDNGGTYGIISDGYLEPWDSVTYYIAFSINESYYRTYNKGEITVAFTDYFSEAPSYDRANCDYLYKIIF